MADPVLFGSIFQDRTTWGAWRVFLAACFGLSLTGEELEVFQRHTGRQRPPTVPAREAWCIAGRRAGKSRIAALLAIFVAAFRDYRNVLAPGEKAIVAVIAADRQQARVVFRYITGLIASVPMLAQLVQRQTQSAVELRGNVVIEVTTNSHRTARGYSFAAVIADEVAFWRDEMSASPDVEVLNAVRPGLATIPGSLLVAISSPYSRRGALWSAYKDHFGKDDDPVFVWRAGTRDMNPTVPEHVIADALAADPAAGTAEYLAEFRSDLEAFVSREAIDAVTILGRFGLPRVHGVQYVAFIDPSGGSADAFTLAVAHSDDRNGVRVAVLDYLAERHPPFSPDTVVAEYADVLASYGISRVQSDKYAGAWVVEAFTKHAIVCEQSAEPKSVLYGNLLPLLNSGRLELLDVPRLHNQLVSLERRTSRVGRDVIDHPPGAHDDVANAAAGALVAAATAVSDHFIRRRTMLASIVHPERRHPFSAVETNLREGLTIRPEAFDLTVTAPRSVHLTIAPTQLAAALAVGYVRGLRAVRRTAVAIASEEDGRLVNEHAEDVDDADVAPVFVVEAMLRLVSPPDDEVTLEEMVELVVQLRDHVGVAIEWVTVEAVASVVARQMLCERSFVTGQLSVTDEPRAHHELKAAIYDGRLETYEYRPFLEEVAALEMEAGHTTGRPIAARAPGQRRTLVADAVAGVLHVLARRRETWDTGVRPRIRRRDVIRSRVQRL